MTAQPPLLTERAPIAGYGNGQFRFGGIAHSGSILILPDGIFAWNAAAAETLTPASLRPVLDCAPNPGFLILGTGPHQIFPPPELRASFDKAGIGLEAMNTGAACRTYNVLLAEERVFAAAFIAVG